MALNEDSPPFWGHQENWGRLMKEAQAQRLPQAYLFYGARGIGKSLVAHAFVAKLFCEREQPYACGECRSCQKMKGFHPDFYVIGLEDEKSEISVEAVRALQKNINKTPLEAPYKFVLITDACAMSRSAANILLKTLEEPPPKTYFILIASNLFALLPTIRSRCFKVHFTAPSLDQSLAWFRAQTLDLDLKEAEFLSALEMAEGSLGLATYFCQQGLMKRLHQWKTHLQNTTRSQHDLVRLVGEALEDEIPWDLFLEALKKDFFKDYVSTQKDEFLCLIDRLSQAQTHLEAYVNKSLVLENLFVTLEKS